MKFLYFLFFVSGSLTCILFSKGIVEQADQLHHQLYFYRSLHHNPGDLSEI